MKIKETIELLAKGLKPYTDGTSNQICLELSIDKESYNRFMLDIEEGTYVGAVVYNESYVSGVFRISYCGVKLIVNIK